MTVIFQNMVCFCVTKIKMHSTLVRSVISNAGCLSIRLYFRFLWGLSLVLGFLSLLIALK
uniref:Uncharacterized protein n=1 Tax=Anguilla anguilla TaxID=7936 RepID=A0A0E9T2N9_ANGAN